LTKKRLIFFLTCLTLLTSAEASFHSSASTEDQFDESYFSIPEYDSHREIATQLVAPFLFITLLLQIGIERVLFFTLDTGNSPFGDKTEKKKAKKQATVISLLIAGMMIPTPIFKNIDLLTAVIFGGGIYILVAILGIAAIVSVWRRL
jgi:hypothetical protein